MSSGRARNGETIGSLLSDRASSEGNRPFARCDSDVLTYATAGAQAARVAGALCELGVERGDRVCVMLPNGVELFQTWFGIQHLGAVAVPINTAYRGDLLTHVLNDSGAALLVIDAELLDRVAFVQGDLKHLTRVVVASSLSAFPGVGETRFDNVAFAHLINGPSLSLADVDDRDPAAILYTSGTTGPSKGAVLCHRGLLLMADNHRRQCDIGRETVCYTSLPLFHAIALVLSSHGALSAGASVVVGKRFSASRFWSEIRQSQAEYASITGSIAQILFKQAPNAEDREHRLRTVYAVPAPAAIHSQFEDRFGVTFIEAYGATDGQVVAYTPRGMRRPGSCGKVIEGFELKVVDDFDEPIGPGKVGEIVYRGKAPYMMALGYHNNPAATAEAHRNSWFHSGDLGYLDEEGFLHFVDRKKDSLRRRGENVSSYDVEKVFNDHPAVFESAAVAVPSDLDEDEIKIVLVLRPDARAEPADMIKWCEPRLAYFMVPRYVEFVEELPKTPNGKVLKYQLRKTGVERCWDREKAGYVLSR
ncbi:MAG: AMP-binding protein [Hyphomonadaceae bacterium]|nr:AMP-binding protein [Hyphomonadaceae bacterium]